MADSHLSQKFQPWSLSELKPVYQLFDNVWFNNRAVKSQIMDWKNWLTLFFTNFDREQFVEQQ